MVMVMLESMVLKVPFGEMFVCFICFINKCWRGTAVAVGSQRPRFFKQTGGRTDEVLMRFGVLLLIRAMPRCSVYVRKRKGWM